MMSARSLFLILVLVQNATVSKLFKFTQLLHVRPPQLRSLNRRGTRRSNWFGNQGLTQVIYYCHHAANNSVINFSVVFAATLLDGHLILG